MLPTIILSPADARLEAREGKFSTLGSTSFRTEDSSQKLGKNTETSSMNNYKLIQETVEVSESLDSTQTLLEQIAENRDENVKTNRSTGTNTSSDTTTTTATIVVAHQHAKLPSMIPAKSCGEEVKNLSRSLENMKSGREPHNILRDVGVETRLEFLQLSKAHEYPVIRHHTHHRIVSSSSTPEINVDLGAKSTSIDGSSLYGGNIRADAALLSINSSYRDGELERNDGTLRMFTRHTPDKDADDRFLALSVYCQEEYEDIDRRSTSALQAAKTFSSDLRVIEACNKMSRTCDTLVERTKSGGHRSMSFTGGGVSDKYI
ncbi:uncharacterized protein EAF02_011881 [Botrytis sinoallii]|uniref:uncharacterized protein n=1 Tax=Botrytis sinoallii TaxID=1463999 RepID=UPI0018FFC3C0|nr:uncharacterized protein EAF02_011881 [Botrytis sinoallii]KAF7853576.1 hypothetical protein EAF02_011881 [Botrytis sinoallii]